jgi:hypothetical protein
MANAVAQNDVEENDGIDGIVSMATVRTTIVTTRLLAAPAAVIALTRAENNIYI